MREIERRQGGLRLLLADLTARREQTEAALRQVREQKARLVEFTVQRNGPVASGRQRRSGTTWTAWRCSATTRIAC